MTPTSGGNCPVCGTAVVQGEQSKAFWQVLQFDCPRCGKFVLCNKMPDFIRTEWFTPQRLSVLSHLIRRKQRSNGKPIEIFDFELSSWGLDDPLPNSAEQADRLIRWIGDHQGRGENEFLRLTMAGWKQYEAIKRAQIESRAAFMAMEFGDEELNHVVESFFKPEVARVGFELRLLSDGQPAGLIDDQLRVALQTSRFVIADLTHANNGAYWEAGFAEGLGRPVIYTCRQEEWNNLDERGRRKVHFDTNHLVTIIWDPTRLDDASTRLTATIRATLPGEAKMTD
ncbi:MAG: hypothetical protein ACREDT_04710 [Methylocella sp.]